MTYEDLIAAKVKMAEVDATVGIWAGGTLLGIALILALFAYWKARKEDYWSVAPFNMFLIAGLLCLFGTPLILNSIYNLCTAEIQARADLANYNLVEIKK